MSDIEPEPDIGDLREMNARLEERNDILRARGRCTPAAHRLIRCDGDPVDRRRSHIDDLLDARSRGRVHLGSGRSSPAPASVHESGRSHRWLSSV